MSKAVNTVNHAILGLKPQKLFYLTQQVPCISCYKFAVDQKHRRRYQLLARLFSKLLFNRSIWKAISLFGRSAEFSISTGGRVQTCRFNAANTQFSAIYAESCGRGYEPITSALLQSLLPQCEVFFDVGSNWGYFAVFAAYHSQFSGKIHAFEPYLPTVRDLNQVVDQLQLNDRIRVHPLGLSDRNAIVDIKTGCFSGLTQIGTVMADVANKKKARVYRLDDLSLPPPDLIKIDVEGHENSVFLGGKNTLINRKPHIIFESLYYPSRPLDCLSPFILLREFGYQFFCPVFICRKGALRMVVEESDWCRNYEQFDDWVELAIRPFDYRERSLFKGTTNFLAVHKDRQAEVLGRYASKGSV